jgi:acyl-CoA hydrolase
MVVGIRVISQNIMTGKKKHCNSSYFSMVAKDETGKSTKVPGLILSNQEDLRRFLRSIEHISNRNNRKTEFSKDNFIPENYKETLKNYNVKIEL